MAHPVFQISRPSVLLFCCVPTSEFHWGSFTYYITHFFHYFDQHLPLVRTVGLRWAEGHMPTQYFGQQLLMPTKYICYIQVVAKRLPTQCLRPSYGPELVSVKIEKS